MLLRKRISIFRQFPILVSLFGKTKGVKAIMINNIKDLSDRSDG